MNVATEIAAALSVLAPRTVRIAAAVIDDVHLAELHPVELAQVEHAVDRRRWEFATGRHVLRELIGVPVAIPVSSRRSPLLPAGLVGSLAHDAEVAVGAVAPASTTLAVGIDIEPSGQMDQDERAVVMRADDADVEPRLVFVLKEATYKAWSGLGGRLLEFHDVRVTVDTDTFVSEVLPDGGRFEGRWTQVTGRWLALTAVQRPCDRQ